MEKLFVYNILMSNSMIPNDDVQLMLEKTRRPTQMNNRSLVKNTSILSTLRHKRSFCGDSFHFITLLSYQTNILWFPWNEGNFACLINENILKGLADC